MKALLARVDETIRIHSLRWVRTGRTIDVQLWGDRRQKVHLERDRDRYVFWSLVAPASLVTESDRRWRELALRVWRKNAHKDLVGFCFDSRDRLIGMIEQPVATLDHEELLTYVEALARECDRFEYKITGLDEQ